MSAEYYGLPTGRLENAHLRLDFLAQAGPRLVRLSLSGSEDNLLAELPGIGWDTPYGRFLLYGGHRLWLSPETLERTYVPDNSGLLVEKLGPGAVRLTQPADAVTHIYKSIEIRLHPGRPALTLRHTLVNQGGSTVEQSAWAITQFPLGGWAVLPQTSQAVDAHSYLPNRNLVLWPYTHWQDPRLHLRDEYILLQGMPVQAPVKLGYLNRQGWMAYRWRDYLFYKRFTPQENVIYPDFGSNAEAYANHQFVELETLAPLIRLEPGQSQEHIEAWEVRGGYAREQTPQSVLRDVEGFLKSLPDFLETG